MLDKYVFISYAREDHDYALALAAALKRQGFSVWVASGNIATGQYWADIVNRAIKDAFVMLVIVTPESQKIENTQYELSQATLQNVRIVPLFRRGDGSAVLMQFDLPGLDVRDNAFQKPVLDELYAILRDLLNEEKKRIEQQSLPLPYLSPDMVRRRLLLNNENTTRPPPPAAQPSVSTRLGSYGQDETEEPPSRQAAKPVTDEVRFTAFRPQHPTVANWHTLLVYAHLDSVVEAVVKDAGLFEESMGGTPESSSTKTAVKLPRNTRLRIVPACDGVTFNPEFREFNWLEDWHRADFRFQPEQRLDGTEDLIVIGVYTDLVPISTLKLAVRFGDPAPTPMHNVQSVAYTHSAPPKTLKQTASMYRQDQIFISYSHADTAVALRFRDTCRALGFDVLIDRDKLRSGEVWNDALKRMIVEADIFQLFWSERAAHSKYVQQEWQYARELQQKKQKPTDFIRPVHWEAPQPKPPPPSELQDLHFAYMPLTGSGLQGVLFQLRVLLQKIIGR